MAVPWHDGRPNPHLVCSSLFGQRVKAGDSIPLAILVTRHALAHLYPGLCYLLSQWSKQGTTGCLGEPGLHVSFRWLKSQGEYGCASFSGTAGWLPRDTKRKPPHFRLPLLLRHAHILSCSKDPMIWGHASASIEENNRTKGRFASGRGTLKG